MLKIQEIREIINLINKSSIEEFVFEQDGTKVKMKKKGAITTSQVVTVPAVEQVVQAVPQPVPAVAAAQPPVQAEQPPAAEQQVQKEAKADESLHKITSPMVGTFYQSPSPDADAYVETGDKVKTDSIVCIVEAMKLFNEIEAEVNGEIVEILVKEGQLVEYGQPLFLVKPE